MSSRRLHKDIRFTQIAKKSDYEFKIVNTLLEVDERQRIMMIDKIKKSFGCLRGRTIGILGLSFKPNTDDVRESPAIENIKILLKRGSKIRTFDPVALEMAKMMLNGKGITYCKDSYEVAKGASALFLATEWN
jgi:UDPglucose 6-dehydrogenase